MYVLVHAGNGSAGSLLSDVRADETRTFDSMFLHYLMQERWDPGCPKQVSEKGG